MKKYQSFIAILAFSTLTSLSGCKKGVLETLPNDRISSEIYWKTESDARSAVNAIYPSLDAVNLFNLEGVTEIGHTNTTFTAEYNIENGTYDASHSRIQTEWTAGYRGIYLANFLLDNIDKIPSTNTALMGQFKGEARSLRAYFYIKLVGLYGDVPLITTNISAADGKAITRTPAKTVWDFIDKELAEAAVLLPTTYAAVDKGRITKGAALALKARADLWAGRYTEAAAAAKQVIDLGVYSLLPEYGKLFNLASENSVEVVLDKQFLTGTITQNAFAFMGPYSQKSSGSNYVPTKALVDLFPMKNGKAITDPSSGFDPKNPYLNRDPRLRFTSYLDGDPLPSGILFRPIPGSGGGDEIGKTQYNTTTGFSLKKYCSTEDFAAPGASGLNFILIRYAEVLLTYAEAKIELNQIDATVFDAINKVRTRTDVGLPALASTLNQAELRAAVRLERTIELAFEGWHLFDIRRWKTAETVMPGKVYGITYYTTAGAPVVVEVPSVNKAFSASKHYLWPIPQKEKTLNPALGQNPGW
jgi:starch-binding outer membrane protein, SusD/RagB family